MEQIKIILRTIFDFLFKLIDIMNDKKIIFSFIAGILFALFPLSSFLTKKRKNWEKDLDHLDHLAHYALHGFLILIMLLSNYGGPVIQNSMLLTIVLYSVLFSLCSNHLSKSKLQVIAFLGIFALVKECMNCILEHFANSQEDQFIINFCIYFTSAYYTIYSLNKKDKVLSFVIYVVVLILFFLIIYAYS